MIQPLIKYKYQLLTICSIIALCIFVYLNTLSGEEIKYNVATKIVNSDVLTLYKENVQLDSLLTDCVNIVVFYSDYSCNDCFIKIANEIETYKSNNIENNLIVLLRSSLFNKYRKDMYKKAKKLLKTENIYFDIHSTDDKWPPVDVKEGIFSMFPIVQTPVILYISDSKRKIEFRSYADLFQSKDSKKSILDLPFSIPTKN